MIDQRGIDAFQVLESFEDESFEERIEILARELELAIKWQRPCLLLVVYSSEYVRSDVETALENHLFDLGQKAAFLKIENEGADDLVRHLREFRDPVNTVFFIDGLRWGRARQAAAYTSLDMQKEYFVEKRIRAVFWLTQNEIMNLAHYAPDFWTYRHCVIEFVEPPKADQALEGALESAWQGIGEYAGQLEATDARITLRESVLAELPEADEASYTRAHMQLTLGILNWRKGDYEKADELLQDALGIAARIQDNWFEAECFNATALVKTSMGRIDEAIQAYKRAIHLAPEQIFAWNNLGSLCAKIGRNDEAIVAFQKAIECNPKDPIGWNGLGNVYYGIGYVDDAIAAYRRSIQFMPTFAQPWSGLGDVYAGIERADEAMKAYQKAIELNKQYARPWLRLAALYVKQDRAQDAVHAYQMALNVEPGNGIVWNELGATYLQSKAYEDAARAFAKAIELDRDYGWAYSNLAFTRAQQGEYQKSIPLYLKSIELLDDDRDKSISWNRLADVYRLLDDYDRAIGAYQTADALHPASSPAPGKKPANEPGGPQQKAEPMKAAGHLPDVQTSGPTTPKSNDLRAPAVRPDPLLDAPYWIFNPTVSSDAEIATALIGGKSLKREEAPRVARADARAPEAKGAAMSKPTIVIKPRVKIHGDAPEGPGGKPEVPQASGTNAQLWNEQGNAYFKAGAFGDAINAYNKAIQLEPSFGWPYTNLALTYLTQAQYPEAILLYQKSIELLKSDKEKAISWNGLGNVYRCSNDYANAVAAYQKAAELDPETAGVRDGADSFQPGQNPKSAQVWNDLGELFLRTGAYEEANNAFNKAIEMEPESGWAHNNLANVLVSQGQYEQAIPLYQKSIALLQENKDKAAVWNRLGNAYRKLNDYDNAIKAYQEAVLLADEGVSLLTRTRFSLLSNMDVDQ
jgi:superkiller protein 3